MSIKSLDTSDLEIFQDIPVAFAIFDLNMNYITYSNQWVSDYGLDEDKDLIGKNHYDIFPEIPQHWRNLHQRCLNGEHLFNKAEKFVRQDGSVQYDAWDIRPWYTRDKKIGGMIATTKNVTSEILLTETENKLEKANYFLNHAQEVANIGHWVFDINAHTLEWSEQTYKIYELDPEKSETNYESFFKTVHPDDREKVDKEYKKSLKNKRPCEILHRILTKDGKIKWVIQNCKTSYDTKGNPTVTVGTVQDVTESKKLERETLRYLKLIDRNIITSSTDLNGIINDVSQAFCDISGYTKAELIGNDHNIIRDPDFPKSLFKTMWNTIKKDNIWKGEIKNIRKDGTHYWLATTISPIYDDNGKKTGYTAIRQDITDKKTIEEISITDGLTGIYNRRHFNKVFSKIINSSKRQNELVSFMILDIDYFKQYNDTYGHQMGDDALIKIAEAMKGSLQRADDYSFRLGGEEFGILFKTDTQDKALKFANTIKKNIEELKIKHSSNISSPYITASIGLICKNALEIQSDTQLYKEADDLLYKAKESGKNKVISNISIGL